MSELFSHTIEYSLRNGNIGLGFQVGLYAVSHDNREVYAQHTGRDPLRVEAFFVDHIEAGVTYVWCATFEVALEVADALSVTTGDAVTLEELQRLTEAVRFAEWCKLCVEAEADGKRLRYSFASHRNRFREDLPDVSESEWRARIREALERGCVDAERETPPNHEP